MIALHAMTRCMSVRWYDGEIACSFACWYHCTIVDGVVEW